MLRKIIALAAVVMLSAATITGCATEKAQEHKGAMVGAGAGAVGGAVVGGIIGKQSGSTGTGILIGALVGGLAGAAIGHYAYDQTRTADEAKKQYEYDPATAQANLVRVESVAVEPASVAPGGKVDLVATYTVLGPEGATMDVVETREMRHDGALQGKPSITVQRTGGTYVSRVPITLPADAAKGEYIVATTIQSGGSSDVREGKFTVN